MSIFNIVGGKLCGNIKHCKGRYILQYPILCWEKHVAIFNIVCRYMWQYILLEGMAAYGFLLLVPAEVWLVAFHYIWGPFEPPARGQSP